MTESDREFIRERVHAAVATLKPLPAPMHWTKCRWCSGPLASPWITPWVLRLGFCSEGCIRDRWNEEG